MAKAVNQRTTTSANAILVITCPIYPSGVTITHYSADKAWSTEQRTLAEVAMGVDGRMTGGRINAAIPMTLELQPDGNGREVFRTITQAQDALGDTFFLSGHLSTPSTGEGYVLTRGVVTKVHMMPDGAKVLQPVAVEITWENIAPELL